MPAPDVDWNEILSAGVATFIVVGAASNELEKFIESSWVIVVTVMVPNDILISHDVMSGAGSRVPVAPFVVIVPDTVYPFWSVG